MLFKGKSIADVLDMTVEEALDFFKAVPRVRDMLTLLHRVGLDYIHVGQQATTLSGGEAQRVKLAKELSKRATGRTLYILDEPTTGLHFHDVAKLLEVLHELVESGNTVVVIEHNLEVIKTADWIIDLGPEGGDGGGEIVATGTPEDIAAVKRSYTGQFLKPVLARGDAGGKRSEAHRGGGVIHPLPLRQRVAKCEPRALSRARGEPVSETLSRVQALVQRGEVEVSRHGLQELAADGILLEDVIAGVGKAKAVEDYPDFHKGPSVLVLQRQFSRPIHVLWGIERGTAAPAVR